MRKNHLFSAMAAAMLLVASCSQEEILSDGQAVNNPVTITVQTPVTATTRAAVTGPEGYSLQCIMQLRDADGLMDEATQTVSVDEATGSATFTISAEDANAATSALFWAQYVSDSDGSVIYDTDDLTNVGYSVTSFTPEQMEAADAFCGAVMSLSNGTSVTLTRPFGKLNVMPNNADDFSTGTLTVTYQAPTGYNVLDGTISANYTDITYTDASFDPSDIWFSNLFFVGNNVSTLFDRPITLDVNGSSYEIPAGTITLEQNYQTNLSMNLTGGTATDIELTIDIQPAWGEHAVEVGSYVNAAGELVSDADQAVAVVFALAGEGIADDSDYGEGKVAAAYAIGLTPSTASRTYATNYLSLNLETTEEGSFAGYAFTSAIQAKMDADTDYRNLSYFFNNNQSPELTGSNLSEWYIPSLAQLQAAADLQDESLQAALAAAYTSDYYCASSSVITYNETEQRIQACLVSIADGTIGAAATLSETTSFHIFPVVTIFE